MASNTEQLTEMEYNVTYIPFQCLLRLNCRHYVHPKAAIFASFTFTRRNRDVCDYCRQAASWVNGKTGFDFHQQREISVSCTPSRLALKPTRGSNPGSKSGRDRNDHPSPPVPWIRMRGATFPLQHTPSWLNCYWSTGTSVRSLKYLLYKVRRQ
jgi:hypothetical protein